jgi:hypothetical protein
VSAPPPHLLPFILFVLIPSNSISARGEERLSKFHRLHSAVLCAYEVTARAVLAGIKSNSLRVEFSWCVRDSSERAH